MPKRRQLVDLLEDIEGAARRHGAASEPDHEVGDLLDALRIAWGLLTPKQQRQVHRDYFRAHLDWKDEPSQQRPGQRGTGLLTPPRPRRQ